LRKPNRRRVGEDTLRRPPLHPTACVVVDCGSDPVQEIRLGDRSLISALNPSGKGPSADDSLRVCTLHYGYLLALTARLASRS